MSFMVPNVNSSSDILNSSGEYGSERGMGWAYEMIF